ncbi:DUF305 domain-containing protein [Streptomyces sp. NPDC017230]|uniref:DUF305 domain-containing protein n=1 Tax=unclassified Streptomyces TaxID=2593676 RepID=UPI0037984F35
MVISLIRRAAVVTACAASLACTGATAAWSVPAAGVVAAAETEGHQPMPTEPVAYEFGETLAKLQGKQLETAFLAEIIPHHRGAIEMAQLELERGVDADIRTHAENVIASQKHQVEQFTRWLRQWYGLTPEEAMKQAPAEARREMAESHKGMQRMLEELRQVPKGEHFDVEFVRMMIPHHSSGVIEFLEPQARAPHAQLRVAAATGILNQEAEIADFRTWLAGHTQDQAKGMGMGMDKGHAKDMDAAGVMPKGAADTGDGASQASTVPMVATGAGLAAASGALGVVVLRRRGAQQD